MIVAFGHRKGVGKDTAAKFLCTYLKTTYPKLVVKHVSFAKKLKDVSFQLFSWAGLKRGIYYDTHYQEKEIILPGIRMSPREIWIQVGNSMRKLWKSIWIDCALKGTKADIVIISDLRFKNEAAEILNAGGYLIRIDRSNITQGTDPAEVSLSGWSAWDHIITNNGSLQDFNSKIEEIAKEVTDRLVTQEIQDGCRGK